MNTKHTTTMPVRPMILRKAEAEHDIVHEINTVSAKHGIPFYELYDILFRLCTEVKEKAELERRDAEMAYHKQLSELSDRNKTEKQEDVTHG